LPIPLHPSLCYGAPIGSNGGPQELPAAEGSRSPGLTWIPKGKNPTGAYHFGW